MKGLCGGIDFLSLWSLFLRVSSVPQSTSLCETDLCVLKSPPVPEQKLEQLVPLNKLYHHQPNSGTRNSLEEFQVKGLAN